MYDSDEKRANPVATAIVTCLALLFSYCANHYESGAAAARKPAAMDILRARARAKCRDNDEADAEENSDARLTAVLKGTKTQDLETLAGKETTICLDSRFTHQDTGFLDRDAIAVYYATENVLAIQDNGRNVNTFFNMSATDHGWDIIQTTAAKMKSGDLAQNENTIAARYSCGKSCTETRLKPESKFDRGTVSKNQSLFHIPPLARFQPEMGLAQH